MKQILFLDDSKHRHETFLKALWDYLPHCAASFCLSYTEAVKVLTLHKHGEDWDVLFLDHDLGEEDQLCIPGKTNKFPTGSDLAELIIELNIRPKLVVIHTYNPAGAKRMKEILEAGQIETCYIPFGYPYTKKVLDLLKKD